VALNLAQVAGGRRLVRAVSSTMARLIADAALTGELALDSWVGALGLAVAQLAAVVAFAGVLLLVRAVTGEVAIAPAAGGKIESVTVTGVQLVTGG